MKNLFLTAIIFLATCAIAAALTISAAPDAGTLTGTERIPIGRGNNQALSTTVNQILTPYRSYSTATQSKLNLKLDKAVFDSYTGQAGGGGGGITSITTSTPTTFSSGTILASSGTLVRAAVAGTDYLAPNGSAASLTNFPTLNQNTTGSAATLTTPRAIQGVNFDGSAAINPINGTGFVKATGTTLSYDNSTYLTTTGNGSSLTGITASQVGAAPATTALQTATCSGTLASIAADTGPFQQVTLNANCTVTAWTQPGSGAKRITVLLVQDATGTRTITWPSGTKWPGGSAPILTTAANSVDAVSCLLTGSAVYCAAANDFK